MSENGHGVQVVTVENDHSYKLNVAELEGVLMKPEIKDLPVVVISVAGAYRGGKSFLLNFFLKYLEAPAEDRLSGKWLETGDDPLTGFSWRGGSTRHTTGILLWSEPMIATMSTGHKVAVLLMDTQGTFDSTSSMKDCSTVFALSTLLSSVQIYNLSMKIQEDNLQHLQLFTEYGKLLKDKSGKPFQVLEFLVRDWMFPYDHPYGAEGGQRYLDAQFKITPNMLKELKDLRQNIRSSFESVTCFLMPHPGFGVLKENFKGSVKEISPEFLNALKELVTSLFSEAKLKVKQVNGQPVKAKELFEYFKTYMNIFNSGEIPSPTSILKATSEAGFLVAVNEARELYERNMTEACGGDDVKSVPALDVQLLHRREVSNALALFNDKKKIGSNEDSAKYLDILAKGLNLREHEYLIINAGKTQKAINYAKAAYEKEVDSIAKGRPLCVHALDLQKVHDDALRAALNKFDVNRKKLSEDIDPDRKSLEKDLSRRRMLLRTTNEQNNKLAKSDLKDEYWQHMMAKVVVKPSLNEDQFTEEHKKTMKSALDQFETRRSMSNEYTEDVYKAELQKELKLSYITLREINNNAHKESFQRALIVFNENMISISEVRKQCLHPQALREKYDEAVCAALKAFRPNRSCEQGLNKSDSDEALVLSIFTNRFEALKDINDSANEIAVYTSFESFKSKYIYLRGPSWWWLLIVPIFETRKHYDEAKEFGLKVFQSKRRKHRYDYDPYKTDLENHLKVHHEAPWEIAAQRTLELYKKTKPSFSELTRATQKIQAAYRGYYVRRNLLRHLKPKVKKGPKAERPGPPVDISGSREIDLGPVIILNVREENVNEIFESRESERLGLQYHPMKTITHVAEAFFDSFRPPSFDDIKPPFKRPGRAHSYTAGMTIKSDQADQSEAPRRRVVATAEATPRRSRTDYDTPQTEQKIIFAEAPISHPIVATAEVTSHRSHVSYATPPTPQSTAEQKMVIADAISGPIVATVEVTPYRSHVSYATSLTAQSAGEQKMVIADKTATSVLETEVLEDLQQDLSERTAADDADADADYSVPTDTSPLRAPSPSDDAGITTDAEDIPEDLPDDEPNNDDKHPT